MGPKRQSPSARLRSAPPQRGRIAFRETPAGAIQWGFCWSRPSPISVGSNPNSFDNLRGRRQAASGSFGQDPIRLKLGAYHVESTGADE